MKNILVTFPPPSPAFPLIARECFHFSLWHSAEAPPITPTFKDANVPTKEVGVEVKNPDSTPGLRKENKEKAGSRTCVLEAWRLNVYGQWSAWTLGSLKSLNSEVEEKGSWDGGCHWRNQGPEWDRTRAVRSNGKEAFTDGKRLPKVSEYGLNQSNMQEWGARVFFLYPGSRIRLDPLA
jgi:hypothetical protein